MLCVPVKARLRSHSTNIDVDSQIFISIITFKNALTNRLPKV